MELVEQIASKALPWEHTLYREILRNNNTKNT